MHGYVVLTFFSCKSLGGIPRTTKESTSKITRNHGETNVYIH
jgi:hypothetical protein